MGHRPQKVPLRLKRGQDGTVRVESAELPEHLRLPASETVRERVYRDSGVLLHWEIRRLGDFSAGQSVSTAEEVLGL